MPIRKAPNPADPCQARVSIADQRSARRLLGDGVGHRVAADQEVKRQCERGEGTDAERVSVIRWLPGFKAHAGRRNLGVGRDGHVHASQIFQHDEGRWQEAQEEGGTPMTACRRWA